ncbi:MAG: hypothetical protein HOP11_08720 [Saprospiraceae bacterium]|nr:hypothetical protein [Saprospiraceae bacterium]
METEIKIFGIRHHGAGSARRLFDSLKVFQPEVICIEMPYESNHVFSTLATSEHQCPLAILFYNPEKPSQSMYYPFAEFSPEYQAMRYAFENGIQIHAIDLPAGMSLLSSNFKKANEDNLNRDQKKMILDPLKYLANQCGYKDAELWWTTYFESWTEGNDLFQVIQDLMHELRQHSKGIDDDETLYREDFMRAEIEKIINQKPYKIAVVCGAWHAPVLQPGNSLPRLERNYKELTSVPIQQSLIPWTNARLKLSSYYTAGILSPSWSECIFSNPQSAVSRWMSIAASIMRKRGIIISTSELIDCERLATELATIRNLPLPGIDELLESCITVLGRSEDERISIIRNEILTGERVGTIALHAEELSLVKEFKSALKELKLNNYWSSDYKEKLHLDLRQHRHLLVSRFLHKSILLGLKWCHKAEVEIQALGTFHEDWNFYWNPDVEIELAHIAIQGIGIEEVIILLIEKELKNENNLGALASLLEHALKANLSSPWIRILDRLKIRSFENTEIIELCTLLNPLVSCISYGSLYEMDKNQLIAIIDFILPKIIVDFGNQSSFINEEKASRLIDSFSLVEKYFLHSKDTLYHELWISETEKNSTLENVHPMVRGFLWNKLLEIHVKNETDFRSELEYQFVSQSKAEKTAQWIEGFLFQSTSFYLLNENVLKTMSQWLHHLSESEFKQVLPLLRRSFSNLGKTELGTIKKLLLSKANENPEKTVLISSIDEERAAIIQNFLKDIL